MERIGSLDAFWPYYLGEHRNPVDRILHFVGTSWFFLVLIGCFVSSPLWFPVAFVLGAGATWYGATRMEAQRAAFVPMAFMLIVGTIAAPATAQARTTAATSSTDPGRTTQRDGAPHWCSQSVSYPARTSASSRT